MLLWQAQTALRRDFSALSCASKWNRSRQKPDIARCRRMMWLPKLRSRQRRRQSSIARSTCNSKNWQAWSKSCKVLTLKLWTSILHAAAIFHVIEKALQSLWPSAIQNTEFNGICSDEYWKVQTSKCRRSMSIVLNMKGSTCEEKVLSNQK